MDIGDRRLLFRRTPDLVGDKMNSEHDDLNAEIAASHEVGLLSENHHSQQATLTAALLLLERAAEVLGQLSHTEAEIRAFFEQQKAGSVK